MLTDVDIDVDINVDIDVFHWKTRFFSPKPNFGRFGKDQHGFAATSNLIRFVLLFSQPST